MRRFDDDGGRRWEVVAGRESWGALFAIFLPVDAGPDVRQAPLAAASYEEAAALFESLDDAALRALLARSEPKQF